MSKILKIHNTYSPLNCSGFERGSKLNKIHQRRVEIQEKEKERSCLKIWWQRDNSSPDKFRPWNKLEEFRLEIRSRTLPSKPFHETLFSPLRVCASQPSLPVELQQSILVLFVMGEISRSASSIEVVSRSGIEIMTVYQTPNILSQVEERNSCNEVSLLHRQGGRCHYGGDVDVLHRLWQYQVARWEASLKELKIQGAGSNCQMFAILCMFVVAKGMAFQDGLALKRAGYFK